MNCFIKYILSVIIFLNIAISYDLSNFEVNLGYNIATKDFDKYSDDGFSARFCYSRNINKYFRWQLSFQYINFYTHNWNDNLSLDSGLPGPSIYVTNSENGYIFQGGLRFTPERGLLKERGIFKPYLGFNAGFAHFNEVTTYQDPDCSWFFSSCDDGYFNLDDINHYETKFIYSIEMGINFNFPKSDNWGLDFGVRYNMLPNSNSFDDYSSECIDQLNGECLQWSDPVSTFADKVDADYYTYYIGFSKSIPY